MERGSRAWGALGGEEGVGGIWANGDPESWIRHMQITGTEHHVLMSKDDVYWLFGLARCY